MPSARILAIHAHPDDVEFQCAGTLALLRDRGCHLTIASMTPGDCGSVDRDAEAIAAIRRGEARDSAALIGADYLCLEFRDLAIFDDDESRRRVVETLRRARPDLVLTAPPVDYLCDHEATSRLVRDACFAATLANYKTRQWEPGPVLPRIPHLYFMDAIEGIDRDGQPQPAGFLVDVSTVAGIKRKMLACHGASATGFSSSTGSMNTSKPRPDGEPCEAPRSASNRPRRSASTSVTPTRRITFSSRSWIRTGGGDRMRPDRKSLEGSPRTQ